MNPSARGRGALPRGAKPERDRQAHEPRETERPPPPQDTTHFRVRSGRVAGPRQRPYGANVREPTVWRSRNNPRDSCNATISNWRDYGPQTLAADIESGGTRAPFEISQNPGISDVSPIKKCRDAVLALNVNNRTLWCRRCRLLAMRRLGACELAVFNTEKLLPRPHPVQGKAASGFFRSVHANLLAQVLI